MRNKIYKNIALALCIIFGASACDDFVGNGFNDNPNAVTSVSLESLLPVGIESAASLQYQVSFTTSQVTQQMYGGGASDHEPFSLPGSWTEAYLVSLLNMDQVVKQATEEGVPHYAGVAQVLMAQTVGMVTDTWENAPYSEALSGFTNPQPAYDSQEDLYVAIDELLTSALVNLSTPAVEGVEIGSEDLVYEGDIAKWIKLAYSLKARYAIHLTNKGATAAADEALSAITSGFDSNDDDFELIYNDVNKNPWHLTPVLANNTGNITIYPGAYFIDEMNGVNFPFTTITEDPRLRVLTTPNDPSFTTLVGTSLDGTQLGNTNLSETSYNTTVDAPVTVMGYAELKFIEAEAYLIKNDNVNAYSAYLEGISATMEKLGVDGSSYLADASVSVGAANLTMALIMKEKYIALFLSPETWVDMRRMGYDTDVYPNFLAPPVEIQDSEVPEGEFPQRALYPPDEYSRNNASVTAAFNSFADQMWRDQ